MNNELKQIGEKLAKLNPAFPISVRVGEVESMVAPGLSKREYFAAMAMQGMLALGPIEGQQDTSVKSQCKHAVTLADAMIAELEFKNDRAE